MNRADIVALITVGVMVVIGLICSVVMVWRDLREPLTDKEDEHKDGFI